MEKKIFHIIAAGEYGGDKTEKNGWNLFGKSKFPNYEKFWQIFVVPITNRPEDIHYNAKSTKEEREISSIHYAIYNNFYYIYHQLSNSLTSEDIFDLSYIKLSNICDLTEELLYRLLIYKKVEIDKDIIEILRKNENKNKDENNNNHIEENINKIIDYLKNRSSYGEISISRLDIINFYFDLKKYLKISRMIRTYRNVIAHSWQTFHINYNDEKRVPKLKYVKKYQDWYKLTVLLKSKKEKKKRLIVRDNFIKMDDLIKEQTDELIQTINDVWNEILTKHLNLVEKNIENKFNDIYDKKLITAESRLLPVSSGTSNLSASMNLKDDK